MVIIFLVAIMVEDVVVGTGVVVALVEVVGVVVVTAVVARVVAGVVVLMVMVVTVLVETELAVILLLAVDPGLIGAVAACSESTQGVCSKYTVGGNLTRRMDSRLQTYACGHTQMNAGENTRAMAFETRVAALPFAFVCPFPFTSRTPQPVASASSVCLHFVSANPC